VQFALTETQQTLKNTVRKFLAAECPMTEVRKLMETATAFDPALWRKIAEQGWNGMILPEEYGGFGMGMVEMAATLEEMGRALLPGPFFSTVLTAGPLLAGTSNSPEKQKYLSAIASGEAKATVALLEDPASWSPDSIQLKAISSAGSYTLDGQKLFVWDAAAADFLICAARLNGELALFLIPAKARGLGITDLPAMDSTRKLYEVAFDGVSLPREGLLAEGKPARAALDHMLDAATVGLVAEMTGGMQRLLEMTVEYAKTRKQFGRPIGSFQVLQHRSVDMLVAVEQARSMAMFAAVMAGEENPLERRKAISAAKVQIGRSARHVGQEAIQLHGGIGMTNEYSVGHYFKRVTMIDQLYGDADTHLSYLGAQGGLFGKVA
jgi:alkylation response protein AidB-like acyl-CoA dehydrogenase